MYSAAKFLDAAGEEPGPVVQKPRASRQSLKEGLDGGLVLKEVCSVNSYCAIKSSRANLSRSYVKDEIGDKPFKFASGNVMTQSWLPCCSPTRIKCTRAAIVQMF